jgi:hypothetical protein
MPAPPNAKMIYDVINHAFKDAAKNKGFLKHDNVPGNWLKAFEVRLVEGNQKHAVFDVTFDYGIFAPGAYPVSDLAMRIEVSSAGIRTINRWSPP